MGAETKKVSVRVNQRIPLPFKALLAPEPGKPKVMHVFNPDCDLHPKVAEVLVKGQPDLYQLAEGKADLEKYTRREEAVRDNVLELVQSLPEKQRYEVYDIMQAAVEAVKDGRSLTVAQAAAAVDGPKIHPILSESVATLADLSQAKLEKMTLPQLGNIYDLIPGKFQPELAENPKKDEALKALTTALQLS